ncbi:hypothetical protein BX600DRAFT_507773 [Xylariales sp. PMI_506]|nr:hypothetical protein BX600DRAFT_507773 [Xylariales sp. PMI_506]
MPPYGTQAYWDDRFQRETDAFDWLLPADSLDAQIRDVLAKVTAEVAAAAAVAAANDNNNTDTPGAMGSPPQSPLSLSLSLSPRLLHVGCGSSSLSFRLRELLGGRGDRITNVDYSSVAIEQCAQRDRGSAAINAPGSWSPMVWQTVDLLLAESVSGLMVGGPTGTRGGGGGGYDVVVDKSTSDSVACGDDVAVSLTPSYPSLGWWYTGNSGSTSSTSTSSTSTSFVSPLASPTTTPRTPTLDPRASRSYRLHPLHVLAVHLAAVTRPRTSRWICVSYSEDRFPFLGKYWSTSTAATPNEAALRAGFPDPRLLWRVERRECVKVPQYPELSTSATAGKTSIVQNTEILHYIYTLVRTDVVLSDLPHRSPF